MQEALYVVEMRFLVPPHLADAARQAMSPYAIDVNTSQRMCFSPDNKPENGNLEDQELNFLLDEPDLSKLTDREIQVFLNDPGLCRFTDLERNMLLSEPDSGNLTDPERTMLLSETGPSRHATHHPKEFLKLSDPGELSDHLLNILQSEPDDSGKLTSA